MERRKYVLTLCVLGLLLFAASSLTAQIENGQFAGTVTDPTGAAISNAKVTVTNPATALNLTVASNSNGYYTVKEVPPGIYKITVEAAGFKTVTNSGVTVNAGTIAHVDFKLLIGKATEVIEVTGDASAVNTESTASRTRTSAGAPTTFPFRIRCRNSSS
jgi:hypothetical protein